MVERDERCIRATGAAAGMLGFGEMLRPKYLEDRAVSADMCVGELPGFEVEKLRQGCFSKTCFVGNPCSHRTGSKEMDRVQIRFTTVGASFKETQVQVKRNKLMLRKGAPQNKSLCQGNNPPTFLTWALFFCDPSLLISHSVQRGIP